MPQFALLCTDCPAVNQTGILSMYDCTRNYINGEWVKSAAGTLHDIINPATETSIGNVCFGTAEDVDAAVVAARTAFESF
ncbi:MAG: aldehyde dehydrogenase family protein, partial [Xanthomonadales bacterium]|nr:aldehyde dehydrogenase family protein [Xanthomonadales bacterium]